MNDAVDLEANAGARLHDWDPDPWTLYAKVIKARLQRTQRMMIEIALQRTTEMDKLTAEDIVQAIPVVHPGFFCVDDALPGICVFPIDMYTAEERPVLSGAGWMALSGKDVHKPQPWGLSVVVVLLLRSTPFVIL